MRMPTLDPSMLECSEYNPEVRTFTDLHIDNFATMSRLPYLDLPHDRVLSIG